MIPEGYVPLVVAETRRAQQWEAGLARRGVDVVRVKTTGAASDKGEWQIAVARAQAIEARRVVSDVLAGRASLPAGPRLSSTGFRALVAIGVVLALLFGLGWLSGR